jgi:hypothetical protein
MSNLYRGPSNDAPYQVSATKIDIYFYISLTHKEITYDIISEIKLIW